MGSTPQPDVIIFDFDGTIADTSACIYQSAVDAFYTLGLPQPDKSALTKAIGLSLPVMLASCSQVELTPEMIEALVAAYRDAFPANSKRYAALFPGITELLGVLAAKGKTLTIATSKSRRGVDEILRQLQIADLFTVVVSDDDVTNKKPNPDMALLILKALRTEPDRALVIGDTVFDVQMGQAAGIPTCAVTWGNQPSEMLEQASPSYIASKPTEIADII